MSQTNGTITPQELAALSRNNDGIELIDVRTPAEFREVHASMARNVPLDKLEPIDFMESRNGHAGEPLYVICRSGSRGAKACGRFLDAGYNNVVNVEGGTNAWESAKLPVQRGKQTISIERQVRIAAGSLVLAGSLLGYFFHPSWLGLPAFVGAGLIFAGVTGTCRMGMLLARMPWNQA